LSSDNDQRVAVYTSQVGWLKNVAKAYKSRESIVLFDDAKIGIDPRQDTIMSMGLKAKVTAREWVGVLISLGIAAMGAWIIVMAVLDPEPYTKVAATVITGAVLLGSGGFVAVKILTDVKPPNIKVATDGSFEINWG
jgi:hypothetical protein